MTDVDPDCKCREGATCVGTSCTFVVPQLPDAGPQPCNVDSECGSCGMVCSYTQNADGGTICVLADGGRPGQVRPDDWQVDLRLRATRSAPRRPTPAHPAFNVLDAGPNPCNVD